MRITVWFSLVNSFMFYHTPSILFHRIFNVVLGKISTRKHKRWEDDGILEVTGKHAVLKVRRASKLCTMFSY